MAPKQRQPAREKNSASKPAAAPKQPASKPAAAPKQPAPKPAAAPKQPAPKPAAAPKQPAPRKKKKLRLDELGDDALHSVLRFVGPLGLGGLALACKRLLGLVKSLSAEAKGTFDRWALAAACAGMACNSLDRCLRNTGGDKLNSGDDDHSFIALCERTGRLRRCSMSQVLRELPAKVNTGYVGDSVGDYVVGSWGRAYRNKTTAITAEQRLALQNSDRGEPNYLHYLIPTVIGCIGGELLRGVIVVCAYLDTYHVGFSLGQKARHFTVERFELLKCSDSFKRLRVLDFGWAHPSDESPREAETVSVIHPHPHPQPWAWSMAWRSGASSLCSLLLASLADPDLPSLAELQTLTLKCYPQQAGFGIMPSYYGPRDPALARGPTLWPVEPVLVLIYKAADAQLAKFEQLPLNSKLVNGVQIKPRPLCWLGSSDLQGLQSHALWRSGDAPGLDQLWDELEAEGLPLATAQSLLLQIVRLKAARHFAGA